MKAIRGDSFSLDKINLAELERRTGISRARLRRLKQNSFQPMPHGNKGRKADYTVLTGYTSVLDNLLKQSITNSSVCLERLRELGYTGGQTAIKEYLSKQENLFIGMIHAFMYMGVPTYVLTDNMKSVVIKRDIDGRPLDINKRSPTYPLHNR